MNQQLLRAYIAQYIENFEEISSKELYKWQAVKHFQEHWNPDADDFSEMLTYALAKTGNLMDSGNYFPKRMIQHISHKRPGQVRDLFNILFDEGIPDQLERIGFFQEEIKRLNSILFPGKNSYQDFRAILVYLSLHNPEGYFFYKYTLFKEICQKLECEIIPRMGDLSSIGQYLEICHIIRDEIQSNNTLLKLHKQRIGKSEYFDQNSHILTQDLLYAIANYLKLNSTPVTTITPQLTLYQYALSPKAKEVMFKSSFIDHVARQKHNKAMGDLGEEIVLRAERQQHPKYQDRIQKAKGDGLGYDILSVDSDGNEKYIEVKTTSGGLERSFFVTATELERSKSEGNKFFLYRLFNLNKKNMTADYYIIQGDLSGYCINPTEFEVILTK